MPSASPSSVMRSWMSGRAGVEQRTVLRREVRVGVGGHQAGAVQVRHQPVAEVLGRQQPHVRGVDRLGLLHVEPRRVGVDVRGVERGRHLRHREDVAVRADRPAEQRQVVEQALGREAAVAVQEQVGLGVALGQLLVALAQHRRQVPEHRRAGADADRLQRLVERDLPRRRRQQVLAAQHVRDAHEGVVDRVDQRVQGLAVGADDDEVRHRARLERHLAAHQVVEGQVRRRASAGAGPARGPRPGTRPSARRSGRGRRRRSRASGPGRPPGGAPRSPPAWRTTRTRGRPRPAGGRRPRTGPSAATAGTARAGRRPRRPRPSPGRASAARPAAAGTTPASRAPRRCPRCGTRRCRPCGARTPS